MNENELRLAIRKELKSINESADVASQVVSGFNQATATPEQVMYAIEIITAALTGTFLFSTWMRMKDRIAKLASTQQNKSNQRVK